MNCHVTIHQMRREKHFKKKWGKKIEERRGIPHHYSKVIGHKDCINNQVLEASGHSALSAKKISINHPIHPQ